MSMSGESALEIFKEIYIQNPLFELKVSKKYASIFQKEIYDIMMKNVSWLLVKDQIEDKKMCSSKEVRQMVSQKANVNFGLV